MTTLLLDALFRWTCNCQFTDVPSGQKEGRMTRKWKFLLVFTAILVLAMSISLVWSAPQKSAQRLTFILPGNKTPVFTPKDRALLETYYEHLRSTLAPGSLDQSTFSPAVERSLVVGSRLPMQLEKDLEPFPAKLESQLSQITGEYGRYRLRNHLLLIKKADLTIFDVMRNAGSK
jgi:hypothetical protein